MNQCHSCLQFSQNMEQAQNNFTQLPAASDIEAAQRILQQHQDIKKSAYRPTCRILLLNEIYVLSL